jgi:hypothetical protein
VGCTKKAASPPQRLSHEFRVAARKWLQIIDFIPTDADMVRVRFGKGAAADKRTAEISYHVNGEQFSVAEKFQEEANVQRDNDADNAAYQLLQNYFSAAFVTASDRVYQGFKGEHDPRCPDDSCSAIYAICQKEARQTLESDERITAPQCKVDANGQLPGIVLK